jgi:O-antigen/teichoic acid export membrane protein
MGNVGRGVSFVFLAQVFRMVAKGGLILILTRYLLTPNEYGQLFLTLSVLGIALMFAGLGLGKSGAKYITDYRETDPELVPVVIRSMYACRAVGITVVAAVLFLFHQAIADAIGNPAIGVLLLVGIGYLATHSLKILTSMVFAGHNRMGLYAALGIVGHVTLILAVPGLVVLGYGLEGALVGYALSAGLTAIVGMLVVHSRFYTRSDAGDVSADETSRVWRQVIRYSVPLMFTRGASVLNSRVDTILLGFFRGATPVAYYTLGKQLVDFLIAPAQSLGFGVSPTFGEQKANENLDSAAHLYERSFTYTVALYGPAAAGIFFVAEPTVTLIFGSDYAGAVPVIQIFSLFVLVRSLDSITSDALDFLGRARSRAIAKVTLAVANFLLNLVLIPPFGLVGATVATVLTQSVYVGIELFIIANELPLHTRRLARSTAIVGAITAGMSLVVYPLVGFATTLPTLFGVVAAGGAVWLVLTALTDVVDLRQLRSTLT